MPPEIVIAIVAWIAIYAALPFFVRPKWRRLHGKNGENGLFKIRVDPDAPKARAVVAHELAEWQYRYRRPWTWFRWTRTDSMRRGINLWGPAVETAYAVEVYGVDEPRFIENEARALSHRSYFDEDDSFDRNRIEREIQQRMPEAREWVDEHLKEIERT